MPKTSYTEQQKRRGLTEVAICAGNTRKAAERLEHQGHKIPRGTLELWARTETEIYAEVRHNVVNQIHSTLAAECEAQAIREGELAELMVTRLRDELDQLPTRDIPGAIRNTEISKAINLEKALLLRGQPTAITEHRAPHELYTKLGRMTGITVNGTAETLDTEDVTDAQLEQAALPAT